MKSQGTIQLYQHENTQEKEALSAGMMYEQKIEF